MGDTDHPSFGTSVPGVASVMQTADVAVTDINGNCSRLLGAAWNYPMELEHPEGFLSDGICWLVFGAQPGRCHGWETLRGSVGGDKIPFFFIYGYILAFAAERALEMRALSLYKLEPCMFWLLSGKRWNVG